MNALDINVPAAIEGLDTFIGGDESNFGKGPTSSQHFVVFVAYDKAHGEKEPEFFIGFDPDVMATAATRKAWRDFGGPDRGPPTDLNAAQLNQFISAMVFTASGQELGPLFRKYYVDRSKVFPPIVRV
jgi:hypothetical protein